MRVLRFFLNVFLCCLLAILLSFTQIGIYALFAAQSPSIDGIHISSDEETTVDYFDSYSFWATDIKTGIEVGPKYRVRNLFAWTWWKTGTKWVDYSIDFVIAVFKPIFVPMAQTQALADYYNYDMNHFNDHLLAEYGSEEELKKAFYELYVVYNRGYGEIPEISKDYVYPEDELMEIYNLIDNVGVETAFARWARHNKELFNINWKLTKYNIDGGARYGKYFTKFISIDSVSHVRSIKTPAVVLYYQNSVSIILSIAFIIKYPVGLFQARIVGKRRRGEIDD